MTYTILDDKGTFKSRYLNDNIYNYLDKTFVIPKDFMFDVINIDDRYLARPDLLSLELYGTDEYADILCKINGISNPFELNSDVTIIAPTMSSLLDFSVRPNVLEREVDEDEPDNTPIAKKKYEKRKPNQAIIGDTRFTIDTTRRVIIY